MYAVQGQGFQLLLEDDGASSPTLDVGAPVCVRNRYLGNLSSGFEVTEVLDDGYRIQRVADGMTFPDVFPAEDVHLERRQDRDRGSYLDRLF
jgi:hypothetical protein